MSFQVGLEEQTIRYPADEPSASELDRLRAESPLLRRIVHRVRQFWRGLAAHVGAEEMLVVTQYLPRPALARFCEMPLDAQRHSLNVLYTLQDAGFYDPNLAAAALLHDVGKVAGDAMGVRLTPWLRTALVLLEALAPHAVRRLAVDDPGAGWRYLLHVHLAHAEIGARWAAEADCSPLTCWLIEHHQDECIVSPTIQSSTDRRGQLLVLLQWADTRN